MIKVLKVTDDSLTPEYNEGDFVIVLKIPCVFKSPKRGDVVVFKQSSYGTLIKQVDRYDPQSGELFVIGTHADSVDSRQFGALYKRDLIGKVIWHVRNPR